MAQSKIKVVPVDFSEQRGLPLTEPFFSLSGEVIPYNSPKPSDIENMLRVDGMASSLETVTTQPIIQNTYHVTPSPGDKGEAAFVQDVLDNVLNMTEITAHMTSAFARRAAFFEKVWVKDGKRTIIGKLVPLPASSCITRVTRLDGTYDGFVQKGIRPDGIPFEEYFDPGKSFVYYHDFLSRPLVGKSLFETAYFDFVDKQKIKRLYYYHCQSVALGKTVTRYEGGDQYGPRKLAEKVGGVRGGGVIGLGPGETVETFESGRSASDFKEALEWLNSQMSLSVNAGFMNLGQRGDRGSWALDAGQRGFFLQTLAAKQDEMAGRFSSYVLNDMLDQNFDDPKYPKYGYEKLSEEERARALEAWLGVVEKKPELIKPDILDALEDNALPMLGIAPSSLASRRSEADKIVEDELEQVEQAAGVS